MRRGSLRHGWAILLFGATPVALAGCASARRPAPVVARVPDSVATRPAGPAYLELDEIVPRPVLARSAPATAPSTKPDARPPIEALVLFARAREAQLDGRRAEAARLLEQAIALDPGSYELHYALARAYRAGMAYDPRSIAELEKAAALEPDHLDVQLDLGRQYLARGDGAAALTRLRLGLQTKDYKTNDPRAVEADLFLAHALQGLGYDRAALNRFELLLKRLAEYGLPRAANPEVVLQITGKLYQQVGDLYLKQGQPARALEAYEAASDDPDDFELQARVVRTLLALGRTQPAATKAAQAVSRFHASPDSVVLLREVYRAVGRENDAASELAKLHAQRPNDRAILFALSDVLRTDGRWPDADRLLAQAAEASPADGELVRRRVALRDSAGDLPGAARLLVEAAARRPDLAGELQDAWARLLRPECHDRLGPRELQDLQVPAGARAARSLGVYYAARAWPRKSLAREALADAVAQRPVFPPAFRERLEQIWDDPGVGVDARIKASEELADAAAGAGEASLAAELRGRALLRKGDAPGAAAALAEAVKLTGAPARSAAAGPPVRPDVRAGNGSEAPPAAAALSDAAPADGAGAATVPNNKDIPPDLHLAFASTLLAFDNGPSFERLVWRLASEHPAYTPAYVALHDYYFARGATDQAEKVTAAWRRAEPQGLAVRLTLARDHLREGRLDNAEMLLNGLFDEFGDDPGVLATITRLYTQTGRSDEIVRRLEERLTRVPGSFNAAERLTMLLLAGNRTADAMRVLEATRLAAAGEPDVLYDLSGLYVRAGQRPAAEGLLRQVLKLEPNHAGASNDLGYFWAEAGTNLAEAESLTRAAVAAEPASPTMLDSLGWVLYKRGRFAEAKEVYDRALAATAPANDVKDDIAEMPDPVMLDHAGDVCYRLNDKEAAGRSWDRSRQRLTELGDEAAEREDLKPLKLHLQQKQRQLQSGQPVTVSPVVETPGTAASRPAQAGAQTGTGVQR